MLLQNHTHYNQDLSNQLNDSQEPQRGVVEGVAGPRRISVANRPQSHIFLLILNHQIIPVMREQVNHSEMASLSDGSLGTKHHPTGDEGDASVFVFVTRPLHITSH